MRNMEVLPPASSGEFISDHASNVKILKGGIEHLSHKIISSIKDGELQIPKLDTNDITLPVDHVRAVDWIFVLDSLNFCFWTLPGQPSWHIGKHSGYYALEAALIRSIKNGIDITDPRYYSTVTIQQLSHILKSDDGTDIPLLKERLSNLHEVGRVLIEKFDGTFESCVKLASGSALKLLQIIIDNFPCYRDEATYKGTKVSFYKRAQILVADVWNFFGGRGLGEFRDIEQLTMFADYRVPQVLVYFGVLEYNNDLMDKLKKDVLLENGSEQEVEIRGCSIHAVELLKKAINKKIKDINKDINVLNSSLIDYYLWCYRRKHEEEMKRVPFHKTLCIYY